MPNPTNPIATALDSTIPEVEAEENGLVTFSMQAMQSVQVNRLQHAQLVEFISNDQLSPADKLYSTYLRGLWMGFYAGCNHVMKEYVERMDNKGEFDNEQL